MQMSKFIDGAVVKNSDTTIVKHVLLEQLMSKTRRKMTLLGANMSKARCKMILPKAAISKTRHNMILLGANIIVKNTS